jgi:transcriptional regulator with XRE-family HTH domain
MTTGALLKKRRLERGLTLEAVALEAGTDPGNLSRIERDAQQPSATLLRKLAQALGVTVTALYAEAETTVLREQPAEYSRSQQQLLRRFQALGPANRQLALEFMKMLARLEKKGD